jgi:hypothetical protein
MDLMILWPSCKSEARRMGVGMDVAKAAFASHAFKDQAWLCLGEDEVTRRIDALA